MVEPVYSDATERLYGQLPEAWGVEDSKLGWPLKRFMSGVGEQFNDVDQMIDRFDYEAPPVGVPGDTSDLVDPNTADSAWLRWLAQIVGVSYVASGSPRSNLVVNSSFEVDTTGWFTQVNCTIARVTTVSKYGVASLRATATVAASMAFSPPRINIASSTAYTVSAYFRAATIARGVALQMYWLDVSNANVGVSNGATVFDVVGDWVRVSMTATSPSNATKLDVVINIVSSGAGEQHYVDGVLVEKTNELLPYFDAQYPDTVADERYLRQRIAAPTKHRAGTKAAIAEAVKGVLTGEKHVEIYDHMTDSGAGTQWDVLIVTRSTETLSDPKAEVIRLGQKPAGIKLWHKTHEASWATIEAARPTWADWDNATWQDIEETGL